MSFAIDLASWVLLAGGGAFCVIGAAGLLRMPDFYTRVHAASITDTIGFGLMLLGMMLQAGFTLVAAKLAIVGLLIFFASPTASHALVKAGMMRRVEPLLGRDRRAPSKP